MVKVIMCEVANWDMGLFELPFELPNVEKNSRKTCKSLNQSGNVRISFLGLHDRLPYQCCSRGHVNVEPQLSNQAWNHKTSRAFLPKLELETMESEFMPPCGWYAFSLNFEEWSNDLFWQKLYPIYCLWRSLETTVNMRDEVNPHDIVEVWTNFESFWTWKCINDELPLLSMDKVSSFDQPPNASKIKSLWTHDDVIEAANSIVQLVYLCLFKDSLQNAGEWLFHFV